MGEGIGGVRVVGWLVSMVKGRSLRWFSCLYVIRAWICLLYLFYFISLYPPNELLLLYMRLSSFFFNCEKEIFFDFFFDFSDGR